MNHLFDQTVLILRDKFGHDIIAQYFKEEGDVLVVKDPFYIRFQATTFGLFPYCLWTDEQYFPFNKGDLHFVVTSSEKIATRYLKMLEGEEELSPEEPQDRPEIPKKNVVSGNGTVH